MKEVIASISLVFLLLVAVTSSAPAEPSDFDPPVAPATLENLKATEVVATLEQPISKGKNAVWCASFLAVWKTLAQQPVEDPFSLKDAEDMAASLNRAPDPRATIPTEALYVASGWVHQGIIEQIQKEVVQKFPTKPAPTFPEATADCFIAYSYIEAGVKFSLPYFQNRQPLEFVDSRGQKTPVMSFGIRPEDDYAYYELRRQPRILFCKRDQGRKILEFAIDLCPASKSAQIVVARIDREPTLAAAISRINKEELDRERLKRIKPDFANGLQGVGPNDVLLVPDVSLLLSHHFSELEGKTFTNAKLKGQRLDIAQQDILFRLDRSGAELKSESKSICRPSPSHYVVDSPFLIYVSQRGSRTPFFALWIDNAEVLSKWEPDSSARPRKE